MLESLTLLHVSDMQFGYNHRFGKLNPGDLNAEMDTLLNRLGDDLDSLREFAAPVILILSGDLAETGAKTEFSDALEFVDKLCKRTGILRENVIIVPGNHDVNRKLCEGYWATCEGNDEAPQSPYWPKWKHFEDLFKQFYATQPEITFTEETPWTLIEIPSFNVVLAGLNSTMEETHKAEGHFGMLGENQIQWFTEKMVKYRDKGWLRIGVIHHNLDPVTVDDKAYLRDASDFRRILAPQLNIVLHGHTHEDGLSWPYNNVPAVATGSAGLKGNAIPEEIGNQYQILKIFPDRCERLTRRYDLHQRRWVGDTRCSVNGDNWQSIIKFVPEAVHATFGSDAGTGVGVSFPEQNKIVVVDRPLDVNTVQQKLKAIPRFSLKTQPQHKAIRGAQRSNFAQRLERERVAWLVADWNSGKEGFLACCLELLTGSEKPQEIFRLQCGDIKNNTEFFTAVDTQFGISFQEFFAALGAIPYQVLLIDDLAPEILEAKDNALFFAAINSILDFCPNLKLILSTRKKPPTIQVEDLTILLPLDTYEVREYLKAHTQARNGVDGDHEIERVEEWSGGLPVHLDRLLERLEYFSLQEILNEAGELLPLSTSESLPVTLKTAVDRLANSENKGSRNSFRLLSVLTVLRDGETFQSIRRFYGRGHFYVANVDELINLALIESVPISQTAADLRAGGSSAFANDVNLPRLLRVPRQVRDYVNTILTNNDREEIIMASTSLLFGPNWWIGKVRLRTNSYGHTTISGPGNEHIVARHLLAKSLEKPAKKTTERYAKLALAYCHKLNNADRFRDALITAAAIVELLRNTEYISQYVDAAHIYGQTLRMTGRLNDSKDILLEALAKSAGLLTDRQLAHVHLSIAFTQNDLGNKALALESAEEVLKLIHKDEGNAIQARSIIIEHKAAPAKRRSQLIELEKLARNKGRTEAANNLALDLARDAKTPEESLVWLHKVIYTAKDNYNLARAIIEKVSVLGPYLRISELRDQERNLLNTAYSYSYSQRIGNLLDKCHTVLWGIFLRDNLWSSLLRLFRFSSFIWRLKNAEDQEIPYLKEFRNIDLQRIAETEGPAVKSELLYLTNRLEAQPKI